MRTKKALFNVASQILLQAVVFLSGLILPRIILVAYGSLINGLLGSIRQILNYLKTMEMGLAGASIIELYKPLAEGDEAAVSRVLSASRHYFNQVGVLFSLGAVVVSIVYPFLVPHGDMQWYSVTGIVLLLALSGAFSFFLVKNLQVMLIADQRSYVISLVSALTGTLSLGLTVGAVRAGCGVFVVPVISGAGILMQALVLRISCYKIYGERFDLRLPVNREAIGQRWDVFVFELSLLVQVNSPVVIVTFMLGLLEVSVYVVYNMVFHSIQSMVRLVSRSLRASFGEIIALSNIDSLRQSFAEFEYLIFLLTGWLYTCAGILLISFVKIYTTGIEDASYVRPVLGYFFLAIGVSRQIHIPSSTIISAAGKYAEIRGNAITVAILSVSLGCLGAFLWGLEGVLVGLTVACVYQSVFYLVFASRHILVQAPWVSVKRIAKNVVFCIVASIPVFKLVEIDPQNPKSWFVCAVGVSSWVGFVVVAGNVVTDWSTSVALYRRARMLARSFC